MLPQPFLLKKTRYHPHNHSIKNREPTTTSPTPNPASPSTHLTQTEVIHIIHANRISIALLYGCKRAYTQSLCFFSSGSVWRTCSYGLLIVRFPDSPFRLLASNIKHQPSTITSNIKYHINPHHIKPPPIHLHPAPKPQNYNLRTIPLQPIPIPIHNNQAPLNLLKFIRNIQIFLIRSQQSYNTPYRTQQK